MNIQRQEGNKYVGFWRFPVWDRLSTWSVTTSVHGQRLLEDWTRNCCSKGGILLRVGIMEEIAVPQQSPENILHLMLNAYLTHMNEINQSLYTDGWVKW